ncbi:MAG: FlgD immunoglobulin-like domain containing protein, partial [Candidatus Cloacimonetes bacterium]|nr:FlgD immunoglobulin-like domain containing protein [Candidatus Cloacimonadota bacterium]
GIPDGTMIPIGLALDAGIQMLNHNIIVPIGAVGEGFETNNFTSFPWINNSSSPWVIESNSSNVHGGNYAAKSGTIGHNGNTSLQLAQQVPMNGTIKFWRKVSSESNYDFLKFYIDGTEMGSWSGTVAWSEVSYPVTAGARTFKWTYSKDGSDTSGSDCAWLDDITFPASGQSNYPMLYTGTEQILLANVQPNSTVSADFAIRNLGSAAMQGMVSIPAGFSLSMNGTALPMDYTYQIPASSTQIFSLSYTAGATVNSFTAQLLITSNDPNNASLEIPVVVQSGSSTEDPVTPVITALERNFPNPFNPETTIRYSVKESGMVKLSIYNLKGQLIRSLVNETKTSGNHRVIWNGVDDRGQSVASGIYFYRMDATNFSSTQKMMLMK